VKRRIIAGFLVVWVAIVITIIYPVKEVQAALPPAMGEAMATVEEKIIGAAVTTRMGLKAASGTALGKASAAWGCRAAVLGGTTGKALATAATVGTGAAVAAGAVTLPAWVPVVLAVGSVASLVSATIDVIDGIKALGEGEQIAIDKGVAVPFVWGTWGKSSFKCWRGAVFTEVPFETVGIRGERISVKQRAGFSRGHYTITVDGNEINILAHEPYYMFDEYTFLYAQNKAYLGYKFNNESYFDKMVVYSVDTSGLDNTVEVWQQEKISMYGSDYLYTDTSIAPVPPINDSQTIIINMPNLDLIRQNNPTWTEEQVEEEALNMIVSNPEYVTAENEFEYPEVGEIGEGLQGIVDYLNGIWQKVCDIASYLNPASDNFILKIAFIPSIDIAEKIDTMKDQANQRIPFAWISMWAAGGSQTYTNDVFEFNWRVGLVDDTEVCFTVEETTGFRNLSTIIIMAAAMWAGYSEVRRFIG